MATVVPNAHALTDWGIWTGRLCLDGRQSFLAEFSADPVAATASLLSTPAQRDSERPCPLFGEGVDSRFSPIAKRGHVMRRVQRATSAEIAGQAVETAVNATATVLGASVDPEVRRAVGQALRDLAKRQRREARRDKQALAAAGGPVSMFDDRERELLARQRAWEEMAAEGFGDFGDMSDCGGAKTLSTPRTTPARARSAASTDSRRRGGRQ